MLIYRQDAGFETFDRREASRKDAALAEERGSPRDLKAEWASYRGAWL
jgi:hypothetical protein